MPVRNGCGNGDENGPVVNLANPTKTCCNPMVPPAKFIHTVLCIFHCTTMVTNVLETHATNWYGQHKLCAPKVIIAGSVDCTKFPPEGMATSKVSLIQWGKERVSAKRGIIAHPLRPKPPNGDVATVARTGTTAVC